MFNSEYPLQHFPITQDFIENGRKRKQKISFSCWKIIMDRENRLTLNGFD